MNSQGIIIPPAQRWRLGRGFEYNSCSFPYDHMQFVAGISDARFGVLPKVRERFCSYCGRKINLDRDDCAGCGAAVVQDLKDALQSL